MPNVPGRPGEVLCGRVQVTANGNQRLSVGVMLTVVDGGRVARRAAVAPQTRRDPEASDEYRPSRRRSSHPGLLAWLFAGTFLLFAFAAVGIVLAVVALTPGGGPAPAPPVAQAPPDAAKPDKPNPPGGEDKAPPKEPPPAPPAPPPPPQLDAADLAPLLESDDADKRLAALKKLAAMGPRAAPAFHAVLKAMKDGDADFRREALAALPKIGAPTAADVDLLADLAGDAKFPEGRAYALDALAALGADAKRAAPALCDVLKDRNSPAAVRRKAAEVLGSLGPAAAEAARDRLTEALSDADPDVGTAAATALAKMGPPKEKVRLQLLLLEKADAARRYALNGFRDLGPEAADCAPYLEDAVAGDPSPELRRLAVGALLAVAPAERRSADAFAKAVSDDDPEVRRAAVGALAKVGPEHGALHGLVQALRADETTAAAAEEALKGLHLDAKQVGELGDELKAKNAKLRLHVLALLKPLGADAAPAVPGACAVLRDGPGEPRKQAFDLLAAMGPAGKKASSALDDLLNDDKFAVRLDAATTLAAVEGSDATEAIPVLIDALKVDRLDDAEQAAERDRAVEALARVGEPAIKPLVDALEGDFTGGGAGTEKGQINALARQAAVRALGAMGRTANTFKALSVLSKLQRIDPSPPVRDAAKEAWAAIKKN